MRTNIAGFFDRIYIINLLSRKDRYDEMNVQLKRIGIGLPNGRIEFYPAIRPESPGSFPSVGSRGAFLSHLNVLNDAFKRNYMRILICEDDLNFSRDFNSRIAGILAELGLRQWSVFYGGYRVTGLYGLVQGQRVINIPSTLSVETTHFIGFQNGAIGSARSYLSAMLDRASGDPRGGPMHVDGAYSWFRRANPQFETLIAVPQLGYQRPSRSDIYRLGWCDRLPIGSTIIGLARLLKSRLKERFK